MHFYIYNCLASVTFYFRVIVSVLLKGASIGLPFLYCQHKTTVPRLQELFSETSQNSSYVYTHTHKYRCVSCRSTSDNGSLHWMEVTETREKQSRVCNPVLFASCNSKILQIISVTAKNHKNQNVETFTEFNGLLL